MKDANTFKIDKDHGGIELDSSINSLVPCRSTRQTSTIWKT